MEAQINKNIEQREVFERSFYAQLELIKSYVEGGNGPDRADTDRRSRSCMRRSCRR